MTTATTTCELCTPSEVVIENALAYVRYDNDSLSRGHALVIPKRHVASFFDLSAEEQAAVVALLNQAQKLIQACRIREAASGAYWRARDNKGGDPMEFRTPHDIAMDGRGRLHVAERGNTSGALNSGYDKLSYLGGSP